MRLLITGASGQLGAYLVREAIRDAREVAAWGGRRTEQESPAALRRVDLENFAETATAFREARADVVLHTAAMASVAACHADAARAARVNTDATRHLAGLCGRSGARLIFTSTDLVFDGESGGYVETDAAAPLSVYGRTKLAAEGSVVASPGGVVARLSLLFGPALNGRPSFFDEQVAALRRGRAVTLFEDEWRSPLSLRCAARALLALVDSDVTGLLHLGGPERMTRAEMGRRLAAAVGADPAAVRAVRRAEVPGPEARPRDASLDSSRWRGRFPAVPWPRWEETVAELATLVPAVFEPARHSSPAG
jgi:dTDP-4-dehydrorhamnose reductase